MKKNLTVLAAIIIMAMVYVGLTSVKAEAMPNPKGWLKEKQFESIKEEYEEDEDYTVTQTYIDEHNVYHIVGTCKCADTDHYCDVVAKFDASYHFKTIDFELTRVDYDDVHAERDGMYQDIDHCPMCALNDEIIH